MSRGKINSALCRLIRDLAGECGTTAVVAAIAAPAIMVGVVMGVDVGAWYTEKTRMQAAADHAAMGGAIEVNQGGSNGDVQAAADGLLTKTGYAAATGTAVVVNGPFDFDGDGMAKEVQVTLTRPAPMYFSPYFMSSFDISVTSVGGLRAATSVCILAKHPSANKALKVSGGAELNLGNCSLQALSTDPTAAFFGNGASTKIYGQYVAAVGTVDTGTADLTNDATGATTGVWSKAPPATDPYATTFAGFVPPSSGCATLPSSAGTYTITASCVEGGTIGNGVNVTFAPTGDVMTVNGDLTVKGSLTATNKTVYVSGDVNGSNAGAVISLTAPTSGTYKGVALASLASGSITINGNTDTAIDGAFYFPNADLTINGGTDMGGDCAMIVGSTVDITGGATIDATGCTASDLTAMISTVALLL